MKKIGILCYLCMSVALTAKIPFHITSIANFSQKPLVQNIQSKASLFLSKKEIVISLAIGIAVLTYVRILQIKRKNFKLEQSLGTIKTDLSTFLQNYAQGQTKHTEDLQNIVNDIQKLKDDIARAIIEVKDVRLENNKLQSGLSALQTNNSHIMSAIKLLQPQQQVVS